MEIGISLFIGFWFMLAGTVATIAVFKDFKKENKK